MKQPKLKHPIVQADKSNLIYGGLTSLDQEEKATCAIHLGQIKAAYLRIIESLNREIRHRKPRTYAGLVAKRGLENEVYRLERFVQTLRDAVQIVNHPSHP